MNSEKLAPLKKRLRLAVEMAGGLEETCRKMGAPRSTVEDHLTCPWRHVPICYVRDYAQAAGVSELWLLHGEIEAPANLPSQPNPTPQQGTDMQKSERPSGRPDLADLLELDAPARRAILDQIGFNGELRHATRSLRHLLMVAVHRLDQLEDRLAGLGGAGERPVVVFMEPKRAEDMRLGAVRS